MVAKFNSKTSLYSFLTFDFKVCIRCQYNQKNSSKMKFDYQKTQNVMLKSNSLKKVKQLMQKSYQRKSDRKIKFLTFITACKSFWPITFLGELFEFYFNGFDLNHPILRFMLPIMNFVTKNINFANFKAERRRNGSTKTKEHIYKCISKSRFTSISVGRLPW
jgi:hypothetical protein